MSDVVHHAANPDLAWVRDLAYSQAVRAGELVFTAGQGGFGPDGELTPGGFAAQLRQAFANLEAALAAHGAGLESITKLNVYLGDRADYDDFKAIRAELFAAPYPASTALMAGGFLVDGMLVEIDAVAVVGRPRT
jgi:enamine deaminase RidA (YjgF/YER057c/UK114 family)